ncbi:MAG: hypothetical protein R6X27_06405 [Candidatus Desulfacyla sp.]
MRKILFDRRDHQLLSIVNDVLNRDDARTSARKLVYPYLHPHGIKEMAESRGLRIAFAVVNLLESLEAGGVDDRLTALTSLRDEVLHTAGGSLPRNTARVLLQIMKELVRAHGDTEKQLRLAHDFRTVVPGNPRIIREQLRRYHLLEMPEEWNQASFDDHVHDANTKGRKSSSHLIMDAWIKGIRRLRVVYYNFLEPRFAVELLEAAKIMGIDLRIGIEFSARFRDKLVQIIWVPRGFADPQDFLCFLAEDAVSEFMAEGKKVSAYQQRYVLSALEAFNVRHRYRIEETWGIEMPPIETREFLSFVGTGQPSTLHLAKLIHQKMLSSMKTRMEPLRERYGRADATERLEITHQVETMNRLDWETIVHDYLAPDKNPGIPDPSVPQDGPDVPQMLHLSPHDIICRLARLHSGFRITLNLSNVDVQDVIELLYDCEGMITRLEIFNLKDYAAGRTAHIAEISRLQQAINHGNVIHLKRLIRNAIERVASSALPDRDDRVQKLANILHDIAALKALYKGAPLKARLGSDSTGRSPRVHGMGLAIQNTLPRRALHEIRNPRARSREIIPVRISALRQVTFHLRSGPNAFINLLYKRLRRVPFLRWIGVERCTDWVVQEDSTRLESPGNVVTLGGVQDYADNGLTLEPSASRRSGTRMSWKYLNTGVKNGLKAFIGFVPAFATFALTKEWWLLAYFGAFIWFGITGLRIILQSVLGGGGIRRSPLLRWDDYINWERFSDSLLFTGFSVPLLDYVTKTLILHHGFGITTSTRPVALYAVMSLVNGLYISSHNVYRGLPRGAAFGNLFRSLLSIPIAVGINAATGGILGAAGVVGVDEILQKWAAVISKAASDLVAGVIEGIADRYQNIRLRLRDYSTKLAGIFETYASLELLFPEVKTLELLKSPERLASAHSGEIKGFTKIMIIDALDLLYFWMYQPRARSAFRLLIRGLSDEERRILIGYPSILRRKKDVTLLFVEGLVGRNFSKALAFYQDHFQEYLDGLKKAEQRIERRDRREVLNREAATDSALLKALNRGCGE